MIMIKDLWSMYHAFEGKAVYLKFKLSSAACRPYKYNEHHKQPWPRKIHYPTIRLMLGTLHLCFFVVVKVKEHISVKKKRVGTEI